MVARAKKVVHAAPAGFALCDPPRGETLGPADAEDFIG